MCSRHPKAVEGRSRSCTCVWRVRIDTVIKYCEDYRATTGRLYCEHPRVSERITVPVVVGNAEATVQIDVDGSVLGAQVLKMTSVQKQSTMLSSTRGCPLRAVSPADAELFATTITNITTGDRSRASQVVLTFLCNFDQLTILSFHFMPSVTRVYVHEVQHLHRNMQVKVGQLASLFRLFPGGHQLLPPDLHTSYTLA